jgi:hypothetical protein
MCLFEEEFKLLQAKCHGIPRYLSKFRDTEFRIP